MKTFKQHLAEDLDISYEGMGGEHNLDDAEVKSRLNAILGSTASMEFINPKAAVAQMEAKLSLLGLNKTGEGDLEFASESGSFDLQFNRYGVVTGKTVDTPHDEFEREEKIVSLNVKYEQNENGTYKVIGSLV